MSREHNKLGKLAKFELLGIDYAKELGRNKELFRSAGITFKDLLEIILKEKSISASISIGDIDNFYSKNFNGHRISEILSSTTDDICRYYMYHDIARDDDGCISVSPPTRAAFFVKWISSFRPCTLDEYAHIEKGSSLEENIMTDKILTYSNEIFALHIASTVLGVKKEDQESSIFRVFEVNELKSIIYHLRYRIKHQDSYQSVFNQIFQTYCV